MDQISIDDAIAAHAARNRALVESFVEKRADLSSKRTIDLHFYARDEHSAKHLAAALQEFGLLQVLYRPAAKAGSDDWNVEGKYSGSVEEVVARDFVEHLVRLALSANSTFDGWGTSL